MTAQIIDGKALSAQLRTEVAQRAATLTAQGTKPGLAVVLVGDNQASQVYVRNKVKACEDVGFHSVLEKYDATMTEAELLARVDALNNDPSIHGILVQLPLPKHIDDHKVIEAIAPEKDVDGFSVRSAGELMSGLPGLRPATPTGLPITGRAAGGPRNLWLQTGHGALGLTLSFGSAQRLVAALAQA